MYFNETNGNGMLKGKLETATASMWNTFQFDTMKFNFVACDLCTCLVCGLWTGLAWTWTQEQTEKKERERNTNIVAWLPTMVYILQAKWNAKRSFCTTKPREIGNVWTCSRNVECVSDQMMETNSSFKIQIEFREKTNYSS